MLLALPVMISQLGHIMVGIADSAMVGKLGATPLAAASLANSMFFLILVFGIGITFGITPLIAQADSEKNTRFGGAVLKNGIYINSIMAVLLFVLVWACSYGTTYLGQEDEVASLTAPYLRIINVSGIFFLAFQTFRQFAEGMSRTLWAMVISVGVNLLNIGLNYLFIFGHWGFPAMGLNGAGYATLISRIIMAIVMAIYVIKLPAFQDFIFHMKKATFDKATAIRILHIGIPSGLQYVFEIGAFAIAAIMIGWLGAASLAAHQIALSLAAATYMLASGISAASTVRIGNQMGLKDYQTMKEVGYTSFAIAAFIMALAGIGFITLNHWLPKLFIDDPAVLSIASQLLIIAAFFQISDGIQSIGLGIHRGLEDTKTPTIITLVSYWVIALPLAYFCGFMLNLGIEGVWYGLAAGLSFAAIGLFTRFYFLSNKIIKTNNYESTKISSR